MIRAVIDANAFVSGVLGLRRDASPPGAVLRRWLAGDFELATSDHVVAEVERTLAKPYFATRLSLQQRSLAISALNERAVRIAPSARVMGVATHPEDDLVLAAAVSAQADYLVTGDRQLLALGEFQGVAIVSPRQFLDILDQEVESRN